MAQNPVRHERALEKVYQNIQALVAQDAESEEGGRAAEAASRLKSAHQLELGWYVAQHHREEFDDFLFELPSLVAATLGLERILLCVD